MSRSLRRTLGESGARVFLPVLSLVLLIPALSAKSDDHDSDDRTCGGLAFTSGFASNGGVTSFAYHRQSGELEKLRTEFATEAPINVATDPNGRFVFTDNSKLNAYVVNRETGAMTPAPGSPYAAGINPRGIAVDPSGRFVYVASYGSNNVSGFAIQNNGRLLPVPGSPFATGLIPFNVLVDGTGKYLYVPNAGSGDDGSPATVSGFAINQTNGALTPLPNSPFATSSLPYSQPTAITEAIKGGYLYVQNEGVGTIAGFKIDLATGGLTEVAGSPFAASGFTIAADPKGRFLYAADANLNKLLAYEIDASSGGLTRLPDSLTATGNDVGAPTIDGTGRFLYEANSTDGAVFEYAINGQTGALKSSADSAIYGIAGANQVAVAEPCGAAHVEFSVKEIAAGNFGSPLHAFEGAGINDAGQVIGNGNYNELSETFEFGTLYSHGNSTLIPALNGGHTNFVAGINNAGRVVGTTSVYPPITPPIPNQAFVYYGGTVHDIDNRRGGQSSGLAINDAGEVTGSASTGTGPLGDTHAFLYKGGGLIDLGTLGGHFSSGQGINNLGQIDGTSAAGDGSMHLFLYDGGKMHDLGRYRGDNTSGGAINDHGEIIGIAMPNSSTGVPLGFVYRQHGYHALPLLMGGANSLPAGLNNAGEVVGAETMLNFSVGFNHAFLFRDGRIHDLNDLVPLVTPLLARANGINDRGQIVATSLDNRVFLLTPIKPK